MNKMNKYFFQRKTSTKESNGTSIVFSLSEEVGVLADALKIFKVNAQIFSFCLFRFYLILTERKIFILKFTI